MRFVNWPPKIPKYLGLASFNYANTWNLQIHSLKKKLKPTWWQSNTCSTTCIQMGVSENGQFTPMKMVFVRFSHNFQTNPDSCPTIPIYQYQIHIPLVFPSTADFRSHKSCCWLYVPFMSPLNTRWIIISSPLFPNKARWKVCRPFILADW